MTYHNPVLLQSSLHFLDIVPGGLYVDATLGGGGHAQAILSRGGKVLGLDQDPDAISQNVSTPDLVCELTNFTHLSEAVKKHHWQPLKGVLFDFGVSSHQLDTASRGFSFQNEGPLDMRMGPSAQYTAETLVNQLSVNQLSNIFVDFGEIPIAKSLAAKIVSARPITTTIELAKIIGPKWTRQVFQSLRIAVNDELTAISEGLQQATDSLINGGRIVAISFHSLEDRIVKNFFKDLQVSGRGEILTPHPVIADPEEIKNNPRSKSAKLRCIKIYEKNNN